MYLVLNVERTQLHSRLYWWKPRGRGYTDDISLAGRYNEASIKTMCAPGEDIAITMDSISVIATARNALERLTGEQCEHKHVEPLPERVQADLIGFAAPPCQGAIACDETPTQRCLECLRVCCAEHAGKREKLIAIQCGECHHVHSLADDMEQRWCNGCRAANGRKLTKTQADAIRAAQGAPGGVLP